MLHFADNLEANLYVKQRHLWLGKLHHLAQPGLHPDVVVVKLSKKIIVIFQGYFEIDRSWKGSIKGGP